MVDKKVGTITSVASEEILNAIEVAGQMDELVEAAYEKANGLREDFRKRNNGFQSSLLTINAGEVFLSEKQFASNFPSFQIEQRLDIDFPYRIFVEIGNVKIHAVASKGFVEDFLQKQQKEKPTSTGMQVGKD